MFKGLSSFVRIYLIVVTVGAVGFGVATISLNASSSAKDEHIAKIESTLASINKKMEEEEARKAQAREATKAFFGGGKTQPPSLDDDQSKEFSILPPRSSKWE